MRVYALPLVVLFTSTISPTISPITKKGEVEVHPLSGDAVLPPETKTPDAKGGPVTSGSPTAVTPQDVDFKEGPDLLRETYKTPELQRGEEFDSILSKIIAPRPETETPDATGGAATSDFPTAVTPQDVDLKDALDRLREAHKTRREKREALRSDLARIQELRRIKRFIPESDLARIRELRRKKREAPLPDLTGIRELFKETQEAPEPDLSGLPQLFEEEVVFPKPPALMNFQGWSLPEMKVFAHGIWEGLLQKREELNKLKKAASHGPKFLAIFKTKKRLDSESDAGKKYSDEMEILAKKVETAKSIFKQMSEESTELFDRKTKEGKDFMKFYENRAKKFNHAPIKELIKYLKKLDKDIRKKRKADTKG